MNTCHCGWFNKEADWPIAGQVEVRWDWKTKREHKEEEEEESQESQGDAREAGDELAILRKGTEPHGRVQISNMGQLKL